MTLFHRFIATLRPLARRARGVLPQAMIYARYCIPSLAVLTFAVMACFHNVQAAVGGVRYELCIWQLFGSTLKGTHDYLGGEQVAEHTTFYAALSVVAILFLLLFLLAAFFAALASYTAVRAFRYGHESEQSNRYKLIFKIAFPNRVCLWLSNALILLPTLLPHAVSFVGSYFLSINGEQQIYVLFNRPLLVMGIFTAIALLLALAIPGYERRKKMNMFLLSHDEQDGMPDTETQENAQDAPETPDEEE